MKILPYTFLATLSIISQSAANDTFSMDVATIKEQALLKTHEKIQNGFELLDIDGNGKLSRRECSGSGSQEALKSFPFFSQSELVELTQKIDSAFDTYDKDKDDYMNPEEAQGYISYVENLGLEMQMNKMDKNGDGQITDDEMSSFMQSMPSIEESMAKLQEATKKIEEINKNPQEYTNNLISNIGGTINKEEFAEMDKNDNNQVTKKEYTSYMYNHPNNKELRFTEEDYQNMFDLIDSDKKGYITKQQYLEYNENQLKNILTETSDEAEPETETLIKEKTQS
ncbi:MAG: EF-hand domain-containing protein [Alphaproteobacteria bacterium]|nr:EF-hand domain-containing protein [Alphaproteobacteria bacterium]